MFLNFKDFILTKLTNKLLQLDFDSKHRYQISQLERKLHLVVTEQFDMYIKKNRIMNHRKIEIVPNYSNRVTIRCQISSFLS